MTPPAPPAKPSPDPAFSRRSIDLTYVLGKEPRRTISLLHLVHRKKENTMKTIDLNQLSHVTGGVRDSGDGTGCIPDQFPFPPRPRPDLPGGDIGLPRPGGPRPPIFGDVQSLPK
jgi:hypothetical protein